ncbi:MAG: YD repeat-containing protein [Cressdnaviricota sp.]|nr:MAG: YD repeat-containing protein [Cressdnaviricota sp.]
MGKSQNSRKKEKKKRKKRAGALLRECDTVIYFTMKRAALYLTVQSICCSKIKGVDPDTVKDGGPTVNDGGSDGVGGNGGGGGTAIRTSDRSSSDSS